MGGKTGDLRCLETKADSHDRQDRVVKEADGVLFQRATAKGADTGLTERQSVEDPSAGSETGGGSMSRRLGVD